MDLTTRAALSNKRRTHLCRETMTVATVMSQLLVWSLKTITITRTLLQTKELQSVRLESHHESRTPKRQPARRQTKCNHHYHPSNYKIREWLEIAPAGNESSHSLKSAIHRRVVCIPRDISPLQGRTCTSNSSIQVKQILQSYQTRRETLSIRNMLNSCRKTLNKKCWHRSNMSTR